MSTLWNWLGGRREREIMPFSARLRIVSRFRTSSRKSRTAVTRSRKTVSILVLTMEAVYWSMSVSSRKVMWSVSALVTLTSRFRVRLLSFTSTIVWFIKVTESSITDSMSVWALDRSFTRDNISSSSPEVAVPNREDKASPTKGSRARLERVFGSWKYSNTDRVTLISLLSSSYSVRNLVQSASGMSWRMSWWCFVIAFAN